MSIMQPGPSIWSRPSYYPMLYKESAQVDALRGDFMGLHEVVCMPGVTVTVQAVGTELFENDEQVDQFTLSGPGIYSIAISDNRYTLITETI